MSDEFPSNSNRNPPPNEKPKIEPIVRATVRKTPMGARLKNLMFAGDTKSAFQTMLMDVILPQAKDMMAEAAQQWLERLIFGDSRSTGQRRGHHRTGNPNYTNYGNRYSGRASSSRSVSDESSVNASLRREDIDNIVVPSRAEANEVIDRMTDLLEKYERVSVSDLKAMLSWSTEITDENWGWENLQTATVKPYRGGYLLLLPKPHPLD